MVASKSLQLSLETVAYLGTASLCVYVAWHRESSLQDFLCVVDRCL